ncbi:putative extracellular nuclease [Gottschalkia purinilytica]|uniref:Putative extracellular nuclease n=1 Tax=Gottschalkia purinilytica TaxID=1503 RepID=A0A0L0WE63_GOTPU|nr:endonuclease/exonuclease/phosphatase family protein [Gottschalkia purinilytica]KNF09759.1 putative extracellular nuclease [Gottschalkia purinilytica]
MKIKRIIKVCMSIALANTMFITSFATTENINNVKRNNLQLVTTEVNKSVESSKDYIAISEAREKPLETEVTVQGIVTGKIGNNVFIQDDTAGIYVYLGETSNKDLSVGNTVKIQGSLYEYRGLKEIKSPLVELISSNNKLPQAKKLKIFQLDENVEGQLVTLENVQVKSVGKENIGYTVVLSDGKDTIDLRVDRYLDPKIPSDTFKVGETITITSPVGQYDNYQLMIRTIEDISKRENGNPEDVENSLRIGSIQGESHISPYKGKSVENVLGIVTGVESKGFYVQDVLSDNNDKTSDAIYVYTSKAPGVKIGDKVKVDGIVDEFAYKGELSKTQIKNPKLKVISSNNALPEPIVLGIGGKQVPRDVVDNDNFTVFDPEEDAIDFYESIEYMRVKVNNPLITGSSPKYKEVYVLPDNGQASRNKLTIHNGIKLSDYVGNPEILIILDKFTNSVTDSLNVRTGDKFKDSIVGIVDYSYGNYNILNTEELPQIVPSNKKRDSEKTKLKPKNNKVTIATYNVENLSPKDTDRINKIAKSIVEDLSSPDIIGLAEVQDNDGNTTSEVTDGSKTYESLITKIKEAGGPQYAYTDISPENGQDGGEPGGNIRVGYVYKPQRVSLVDVGKKGDAVTGVSMKGENLSLNPGRIDPLNSAFKSSRKPIVAEFEFKGEKIFVIGNHLNSKSGDDKAFGSTQPPLRSSETIRHEQAKVINNFSKQILRNSPNANVVILGDLNDFEFSETLNILKGNEFTNTIENLPVSERFNYMYKGNSQVLDHILVDNKAADKTKVDIVNINSEYTQAGGRVSDHDPIVVELKMEKNSSKVLPKKHANSIISKIKSLFA